MSPELKAIAAKSAKIVGRATSYRTLTSGKLDWEAVDGNPQTLADEAGLSLDLYSLARMAASEVGRNGPALYHVLVCECVRNDAARAKQSVSSYILNRNRASYAFTKGLYGRQEGRKVASYRDPSERSVAAAVYALGGSSLAKGCQRFYDPKSQNSGKQAGEELRFDAIGIANKWGAEGWNWIGAMEGVSPARLCLLKLGKPNQNIGAWLAMLDEMQKQNPVGPVVAGLKAGGFV